MTTRHPSVRCDRSAVALSAQREHLSSVSAFLRTAALATTAILLAIALPAAGDDAPRPTPSFSLRPSAVQPVRVMPPQSTSARIVATQLACIRVGTTSTCRQERRALAGEGTTLVPLARLGIHDVNVLLASMTIEPRAGVPDSTRGDLSLVFPAPTWPWDRKWLWP